MTSDCDEGSPSFSSSQLVKWRWPALLACGAAAVFLYSASEPHELRALGGFNLDTDGDGLTDVQEGILGTYPTDPDSDRDGFSDLEEVARQSDPMSRFSVPASTDHSVGIYARQEGSVLTIGWAIYLSPTSPPQVSFQQGLVINGSPVNMPVIPLISTAIVTVPTQSQSGATVTKMELPIPASLLQDWGPLAVYALLSYTGSTSSLAVADVLNLVAMGGKAASVEMVTAAPGGGGTGGGEGADSGGSGQGGLIYTPLVSDDDVPQSFTAGQICFQASTPVGLNGASIIQEIESAGCQPSESYCSATDCSAAVGTTVSVVDPALLIGG